MMTIQQQLLTLGVVILALQICRWLPFWAFPAHRPIPPYIQYLGIALPPAVFGMLVVYCYKNVDILGQYYGLAEISAGLLVIGIHLWKRNMFLSIFTGTAFYMVLVQKVLI